MKHESRRAAAYLFCASAIANIFLPTKAIAVPTTQTACRPPVVLRAPETCLENGRGHACLVTGNGYGYAVVDAEKSQLNKFYAHPYSNQREDHNNPRGEGIKTLNTITQAAWKPFTGKILAPKYLDQSGVIVTKQNGIQQAYFLPFELNRNVLITTLE